MHFQVIEFLARVRDLHPEAFQDRRVLEVGSRYINGTIRPLFRRCQYTGLDLAYGPGVDVVCHVADYCAADCAVPPQAPGYDTVVSCEALEHDARWADSLASMYRLTEPGGFLIITAAGPGRPEHGTHEHAPSDSPATNDHYQNIDEGMFWSVLKPEGFTEHHMEVLDGDFRFVGVKA